MVRDWLSALPFLGLVRSSPQPVAEPPMRRDPAPMKISAAAMAASRDRAYQDSSQTFSLPAPMPGVLPKDTAPAMAQDDAIEGFYDFAMQAPLGEGLHFYGYPYLAELAQRPEYRMVVGTFAREMTRKWIKFQASGDDDKTEKIRKLEDAFIKFKVKDAFKQAIEIDGYFGRAHLYIDIDKVRDDDELLQSPLRIDPRTIKKGSLRGFTTVEPIWTYPNAYNAIEPLRPDFMRPTSWYVMGKRIHVSQAANLYSAPGA